MKEKLKILMFILAILAGLTILIPNKVEATDTILREITIDNSAIKPVSGEEPKLIELTGNEPYIIKE